MTKTVSIVKTRPKHRNYVPGCPSNNSSINSHLISQDLPPSVLPPLGGEEGGLSKSINFLGQNVEFEEVLVAVTKLSNKQQKEILDHLALILRNNSTSASNRDVDLWIQAVVAELKRILNVSYILLPPTKQSIVGWNFVQDFMQSSGLQESTVVQRAGVYRLLAGLLVSHAQGVASYLKQPLSVKFVLSCSNSIPGLFDSAYPGYSSSGMAKMVISAMKT